MSSQVIENSNSSATTETNNRSQEFAQMNGAEIEKNSSSSIEVTLSEEPKEPEEVVTTRPIAGHPLLKGLTVSGGVLLLVLIFWGMIGTLTGALNEKGNNQTQQSAKTSQDMKQDKEEEEDGNLKTAMAITTQKGELQSISKKDNGDVSPTPSPTTTPTATVTVKTQPRITRSPTTYQAPPSPPIPVTRPSTSYQATPRVRQLASVTTPAPQPKPVKSNVGNTNPLPKVKTTPKDPMQEWLAVANIGNYASSDSSSGESNNEVTDLKNAGVEGSTGVRPASVSSNQEVPLKASRGSRGSGGSWGRQEPLNNNFLSPPASPALTQSPQTNYDGKRVLVGTRATGVMETPIAWVGSGVNNQQQAQNCLIKLSEPLKGFDGKEVLTKGSYIVAILNPTNSEIAQMTAVSALINIDGQTQERQLPANSILILGKNGNLLKAESRKGGSNLGNSLMASLLGGLSKAAEIQNRANSETTISSLGTTTTTTSNSEKDLVAGFAQGSINEILGRMKNSNEQQLQGLQQQQQVFVIEAGKQVQVFVNQSILI
ncbi:hypothetical protein NIES37_68670 [Tolypothrix tenuis PCC 7101]|uniref:Conjugation TrbI family protein n=1 Tax=Tolypothrix tenuis PCC 7101 TaxID=231146 RepID=A0A1Z4NAU5_9CYAN|nr:hypothetical protein [Aulosira sp. FACHB-113]BAZ02854.1 hypothetical protein NIES37_68670 [Tolypothrix tenuis PCC 7101]BAZ78252.1 hypothetical protein NIES50_68850 [Aulosira laxa NIES-50]